MITKKELQGFAKNLGFNLGQAEKTYLQIITLHAISKLMPEKLVFKGGTALMICHSLDRFSEDLDFTAKTDSVEEILTEIKAYLSSQNIFVEEKFLRKTNISRKYLLRYQGPLYDGTSQTTSKIELDISLREKILKEPNTTRIIHQYPDTPTFYLQTMSLEEVFAEKIRAIITRNKARDLFDADFLISKKVSVDIELINQKLSYYKKTFSLKLLEESIDNKSDVWKPELNNLVKIMPDFIAVKNNIMNYFIK